MIIYDAAFFQLYSIFLNNEKTVSILLLLVAFSFKTMWRNQYYKFILRLNLFAIKYMTLLISLFFFLH